MLVPVEVSAGLTWWEVLRPYRWPAATYVTVLLIAAGVGTAAPIVVGRIVSALTAPVVDLGQVLALVGAFFAVALVGSTLGVTTRWLSDAISQRVIARVRSLVFAHLQSLPLAFFTQNPTGSIVSRLSTDVSNAQATVIGPINATVTNSAQLVLAVVALASLSVPVALAALLVVPLVWAPSRWFAPRILRLQHRLADANASTMALMTERFSIPGATLVKLFGSPEREAKEFDRSVSGVRGAEVRLGMTTQLYSASFSLVSVVGQATVYAVGAYLVVRHALSPGAIIAMSLLLTRIYPPLQAMASAPADLSRARVALRRISQLWSLGQTEINATNTAGNAGEKNSTCKLRRPLPDGSLSVRLRDVHYTYENVQTSALCLDPPDASAAPGEPPTTLRGVTLDVPAGSSMMITGSSGSGKSTVAALMAGLLTPDEGSVEIGGIDTREVDPDQLREAVTMVLQDSHFFHGTISENLRYAVPGASVEQLWETITAAGLTELVEQLPDGLDTMIGEQGFTLSGGERQRLAIARAILRRPRVIVLDEATAHLDPRTTDCVTRSLHHATQGCTTVVITHRPDEMHEIDQVTVLESGRVTGTSVA